MTRIKAILTVHLLLICCALIFDTGTNVGIGTTSPKARLVYLHPELFGAPAEKSIAAARHLNVLKVAKEGKSKSKD